MSERKRINELIQKAKRQLLIGLLEATSGIWFEKIADDCDTLPDDCSSIARSSIFGGIESLPVPAAYSAAN